jgi:hypothetical protein
MKLSTLTMSWCDLMLNHLWITNVWTSYVCYNITIDFLASTCKFVIGYEFSATGANVPTDACGDQDSLAPEFQSGPHSSSLMVNFRSNRRNTGMDFFLAITCTLPQESSLATNGNDASTASITSFSAARPRSQGRTECTRTRSVSGAVVGADPRRFISARQYIVSFLDACVLIIETLYYVFWLHCIL